MPTSTRLDLPNLIGTMWASSPTKCDKENLYMKATGIVRRIEARVIITQKSLKAA